MASTNKNSAAGSNHSSSISPSPAAADADADQSKLFAKITIGTRLDIYWPDDDVYYPATVARHLPNETQQHVYTIDYDDGEKDDLDLATEQFHILGLLSAAAAASSSPRKPTNFTSNNGSYNLKLKPPTLPPGKTEITQPCPEIGEGWTQQVVARSNNNSKSSGRSSDRYFHSPDGTKFRSMAEVNRFLNGEGVDSIKKSPARGPFKSPVKNGKSHDTKKAKGISSRSKSPTTKMKAIAIGTRVEIYWPGDEVYYPGTVAARLPNELQQQQHVYTIDYDDGESHMVDMAAEQFRILDDTVASSNDEKMSDGNGSVDQMRTSDESAGASKKRPFDSMARDQDTDDGACLTAPNEVPGGTDAIMQRMLSKISGMDALIQKMISSEVQNVQQQMDDRENAHKEELQKMQAKLNQAEDQNSKLKETNDKLSQELKNAREEISSFGLLEEGTCRNPREGSRIQQLALIEKKLASSDKKVDTLKKDIQMNFGNYEELKPKLDKSNEQVESTKKLLQDMENMVKTMKSGSNNDGVETSIEAMNNAVIELKQELTRNENKVKTLGDDSYKEKKAWNDRSREHNTLRKEITEMKDKREVLREVTETTLTIGYPKWSYSVGQAIATLVEPNDHMLKSLRLSGITLNDDGVISLAKSLGNNTNLKLLAVNPQSITPVGLRAIIGALFDVSCLNDCVWSNHTCQVEGLGYRYDINKNAASTNRVMKIFAILARKEKEMLDMDCLSGVPIELIPKLLSLAQKFTERTPELGNAHVCLRPGEEVAHWKHTMCGEKKSLTCVFEILRCLALPSLFA